MMSLLPPFPASLTALPTELLLQILGYLSPPAHPIYAPTHLRSLRLTCRSLHSIVTPLYWSSHALQIEAWGFDGLEEDHPSLAGPKSSIKSLREGLSRKLKDVDGKLRKGERYEEQKRALEWTESEMWCYRVNEEGRTRLRNLGWLKEMPEAPRKEIKSVWIYGKLYISFYGRALDCF
jgi:hypothetical protein